MRSHVAPVVAVACLAALLGGCGSAAKSPSAGEAFAKRANAICRAASRTRLPDRASARTRAELARMDATIKRADRDVLARLRALAPPPHARQRVEAWLSTSDEARHAFNLVLDASGGRIPWAAAMQRGAGNLAAANRRAGALARRLGATSCIAPDAFTSYASRRG
jgi:hypothetical protein